MEEKKTIFNIVEQIFATYGVIILLFLFLGKFADEAAISISSIFALGTQGLTTDTLLQLFGFSVILSVLYIFFLTDRVIKNFSIVARGVAFIVGVILVIIAFVYLFHWFPMDDITAWIGFFICYALCTSVSVIIAVIKEKSENRKMEKALKKLHES